MCIMHLREIPPSSLQHLKTLLLLVCLSSMATTTETSSISSSSSPPSPLSSPASPIFSLPALPSSVFFIALSSSSSFSSSSGYGNTSLYTPCPGRYCGRTHLSDGQASDCGACPHAYKTDGYFCYPCEASPSPYEILFLFVLTVLLFLIHEYFLISKHSVSFTRFLSASLIVLLEVVISSIMALLLQEPVGSLHMYSCGMSRLSDWYPYLDNPRPAYTSELHCANEAAFPLVTWALLLVTFNLISIFVIRIPAFKILHIYMGIRGGRRVFVGGGGGEGCKWEFVHMYVCV